MYEKKTSSQLKQISRGLMLGKYRNAISILLVSDLIMNTLSLFTSIASTSTTGFILGLMISFLLVLFGSILYVGECSFYLNIACNQSYQFSDLFSGFKIHPDKTIILQLIVQLLTLLPLIPAIVLFIITIYTNEMSICFLLGCLLLILGAGISVWIYLRFSQIYYMLLDFPNYSTLELLKLSWKLMKGNVGRLLYLHISFLPIMLAGLLSFGIGLLFVQPYQKMTYSLFYLDLIHQD